MTLVRSLARFRAGALLGALALAAGCRGGSRAGAEQETAVQPTVVGPDAIVVLDTTEVRTGPVVVGTLEPERAANVRAEVAGTILQTYAEQGERVAAGALLARIDQRAVEDAYLSAQSQLRSAEASLDLARRNAERSEALAKAGAIAQRDLEQARSALAAAEASVADARARLVAAEKTLAYTRVRAPIAGVVSERAVSAGDVVQVGAALYTIVDPTSLRLEGTVPAERIAEIRPGAPVPFTVNGYPGRTFSGRIDRVNPTADPATRQVRVYVSIPNTDQRLVAGLFAEGRVGTDIRRGLFAPVGAVDQRGVLPSVTRLRGGRAEEVQVQLGLRDPAGDRVELRSGVSAGDTLILASAAVAPGAPVRVQRMETAGGTAKGQ